jgi:hypothetical protein
VASAASSYSSRETVTLQLPSGELIDADVPAGLSDQEINSRMHQQHPEFYPVQVSDSMRDQALKSIPRPSIPMQQQYLIGDGDPGQSTGQHVLSEATDLAKGAVGSAGEVSTPNIANQLYKQIKGQPNTLKDLPGKAAMFLLPLMGNWGMESDGAASTIAEEKQAQAAGQGMPQTLGARPPEPTDAEVPLYQKLGVKTSPGFRMPPTREAVPLKPSGSITDQIKQGVPLGALENPPDAAAQMRQRLGLEPAQTPSPTALGQSQFPPPSKIYRTQGEVNADTMEDHSIQDLMRDRFARDEAANESEVLKNQAAGMSMNKPKGVQADEFAISQGRAPKPRQPNEYGYKKPINQLQSFSDLTDLLRQSVREANMRKAGAKR